jgi:integrase
MSVGKVRGYVAEELASLSLIGMPAGRGGGRARETRWDSVVPGLGARHYASGRVIYIAQVEAAGRTVSVTIGNAAAITRRQARDITRRVKLRALTGSNPAQARREVRSTPSFAKFLGDYFDRVAPMWKPKTRSTSEYYRHAHLDAAFAGLHLDEIVHADVQKWFAGVTDRAGPGAANRTLDILLAAFNKAELWGLRPEGSNPCRGIKRNRQRKFERFLSEAEIERLGKALTFREQCWPGPIAIVRLLLLTGCRFGEIASLTWGEVKGRRLRLEDSKTGARTVWLGAEAHAILAGLRRGKPANHVFINPVTGRPFASVHHYWRIILEEAGLRSVRIHDLRHSFASHAAAASETLPMIGKLLGHARVDTTARYAHLDDSQLLGVAERIGALIVRAMAC